MTCVAPQIVDLESHPYNQALRLELYQRLLKGRSWPIVAVENSCLLVPKLKIRLFWKMQARLAIYEHAGEDLYYLSVIKNL